MPMSASDIVAFADEFRRLASEFSAEARRLRKANLPEQLSPEEMEGRAAYDETMRRLSPVARHAFAVTPEQREQKRRMRNEEQSLANCRPHAVRATRIVLKVLDQIHIQDLAWLKVDAAALDASNEESVATFWWRRIVPSVASSDPSTTRPQQRTNRFEDSTRTCERISAILMHIQPAAENHLDLSVKGLKEATGESEGTIREAANAAGVKRPGRGEHHKQFSKDDVYRIAVQRGKSSRLREERRVKWNELLKKLGLPTLDQPLRAIRKTPAK